MKIIRSEVGLASIQSGSKRDTLRVLKGYFAGSKG